MEQYTVTGMSCCVQRTRVEKGSFQGAGGGLLFGEPADKFHGRGRDSGQADIVAAVEEAGYGAAPKASEAKGKAASGISGGEDMLKDRETPAAEKRLYLVHWLSGRAHVLFHGAYDVELAGFRPFWQTTMWLWAFTADSDGRSHGDQPEVFYQRF